ncbi:ATP-dependent zinc metalloprotease FtsH [Mesomycoplasma neurolyticum]|uniref:ATP-dependent zinc metalloprotease FtsH n=1 Tax=Mesomycoplasma neurolyticum TaxID=2120 RepID=A0A449A5M7_9BACT|nr:ATP-dependent zinc metalloprotease FtsH [Mesomycoplasma neurolyticum]VEU59561.1 AAA family ATPase [Mesomycoplasma neurolyticum]
MKFFKKWKILKIILLIFITLLVGSIIYDRFLGKENIITINELDQMIEKFAKDEKDNNFFMKFEINPEKWKAYIMAVEEGKTNNYVVKLDPSLISKYQTNKEVYENIAKAVKWNVGTTPLPSEISEKINKLRNIQQLGFYNSGRTEIGLTQRILGFIPGILPFLIFGLFFYFIYKSSSQTGSGGGLFGPQSQNLASRVISDKKFSDIAGNKEAKEEVMELVDYLKNPKKYQAAGARIPKGILLGGPPGTGKTLLAKATAGEANVPFLFISASNFVELYVGMGAKRVRELFKEARKEAPAIIFIDELDAVGRSRGSGIGGGNDEREQTLNQLLVEMDGMTNNSGILVMAATNRTDVLDPALQRPGRFDRTITVGYPDVKEREEILELHARGKRISKEINFKNIAKRTPGFSGAQLENVINEASILSVRENTNVVTSSQIDEAIDRVMSGPAKKHRTITEAERTMVAYHEAGHAVVGIKIPGGNKVQKITIIPRGNAGGYNLMLPEEEKYNATKSELLAMIASFMGGRAAEEIMYGPKEISTGAANDIEKATKIARRMVTEFGMSALGPIQYEADTTNPFLGRDYAKNMSFSSKVGHEIDIEVRKIISEAYSQARNVLLNNKELLELIKTSLLENETIVSEEIEYIAKHMKLPPKKQAEEVRRNKKLSLDELIKNSKSQTNTNNQNEQNTNFNK